MTNRSAEEIRAEIEDFEARHIQSIRRLHDPEAPIFDITSESADRIAREVATRVGAPSVRAPARRTKRSRGASSGRREGDVEKGIPIVRQMGKITFDDASDDLLKDYKTNGKRTHGHAERRIELHLKPVFTGKRLASTHTADIRAYAAARKATGAASATINRTESAKAQTA